MKAKKLKNIKLFSILSISLVSTTIIISCANNKIIENKENINKLENNEENKDTGKLIQVDSNVSDVSKIDKEKKEISDNLNSESVNTASLKEKAESIKLDLKDEAKRAIKEFYLKPYSASFTKENFSSYFKIIADKSLETKLNNITIDKNNINLINFDIEVLDKSKNEKLNKIFTFKSENNINELIDKLTNSNNFDDYFDYDKSIKNKFIVDEIFEQKNFVNYFIPKKIRYFDYKLISFKQDDNKQNVSLKIGLYLQNNEIKTFEVTSENWKGKPYFNLSKEEKTKLDIQWYIDKGNESLELRDSSKLVPTLILPSKIELNSVFKVKEFEGYKITLEKTSFHDKNGSLKYKFKVENNIDKTVTHSKEHWMGLLRKEDDPENYKDFSDTYFSTKDELKTDSKFTKLKEQVDKINGSNFTPRRVSNFQYLDPSSMSAENLKYFLGFRDPNKGISGSRDEPSNKIIADKETKNDININHLRNQYYFAFYNVKASNPNSQGLNRDLSFKVGFIRKDNPEIKHHTKEITLKNQSNTLADKYYAMEDLSNLGLENIEIQKNVIQSMSSSDFAQKINSQKDKTENKYYVKVKYQKDFFIFKNYKLDNETSPKYVENFYIYEAKEANDPEGSVYIKLGGLNNQKSITWLKIDGFKKQKATSWSFPKSEHEKFIDLANNANLTTIQKENNEFWRLRKLEFNASNGMWLVNKDKTKVEFFMPKEYYEPVFENKQGIIKNAQFRLQLPIMFNNKVSNVWERFGKNRNFSWPVAIFDYETLKNDKKLVINELQMQGAVVNGKVTRENFSINVELTDKGIKFEIIPKNKTYKFTQNYHSDLERGYNSEKYANLTNLTPEQINKDIAIFYDTHGTNIFLEYTSDIQVEKFSEQKTNEFKYKNVTYNQFENPVAIENKYKKDEPFKYNPNQNVEQKWTSGYKPDYEVMPYDSDLDIIKNIGARTFAAAGGSFTVIRKINGDPNDYRYYALSNQHVVTTTFDMWNRPTLDDPNINKKAYIRGFNKHISNSLFNAPGYSDGHENIKDVPLKVFWSGESPIGKDLTKTNQKYDGNIVIFDIKEAITRAKRESRFELSEWLENWKNLKPLTFTYDYRHDSPFIDNLALDYALGSFPAGKRSHYLINRAKFQNDERISLYQNGITCLYFSGGGSGSGIINSRNEYVGAVNSGNFGYLFAFALGTRNYDYIGGNNDSNPFLKNQAFSILAHMYRANLYDPRTYAFNEQMEVK
ncbi:MGA_1079 family surface serine endopeptidase [Mycoplasmopsis alligatoris]|uniref:Lipoprotein n=1 Tax=Mycoplasmopsis alligatoris A21JP2 TaxID=747682 RepID=D4XWU1_9BACT|nr:hypothetical protein [Mycoplasmopsis alligatoris]EFF41257.1 hypothetical protein MALL_0336 [Mycoplasmopsis alligatoris A21JP2]